MTFDLKNIKEREDLIKAIKDLKDAQGQQRFTVHGVLTPNDLFWDMPEEELAYLHDACFINEAPMMKQTEAKPEKQYNKGKLGGEPFKNFLKEIKEDIPTIVERLGIATTESPEEKLTSYEHKAIVPGSAYAAVQKKIQNEIREQKEPNVTLISPEFSYVIRKSFITKALASMWSKQFNFKHTKRLMLDLFIRHMQPKGVDGIVVVDDSDDVRMALQKFTPVNPDQEYIPVDFIFVNRKHWKEQKYNEDMSRVSVLPHRLAVQLAHIGGNRAGCLPLTREAHNLFNGDSCYSDPLIQEIAPSEAKAAQAIPMNEITPPDEAKALSRCNPLLKFVMENPFFSFFALASVAICILVLSCEPVTELVGNLGAALSGGLVSGFSTDALVIGTSAVVINTGLVTGVAKGIHSFFRDCMEDDTPLSNSTPIPETKWV